MQNASNLVRKAQGLELLVGIVKEKSNRDNKSLLAAATGAIWKCAGLEENVLQLDSVYI